MELVVKVSQDIMDLLGFAIFNTGNPNEDYGTFYEPDLTANPEVIFTNIYEAPNIFKLLNIAKQ